MLFNSSLIARHKSQCLVCPCHSGFCLLLSLPPSLSVEYKVVLLFSGRGSDNQEEYFGQNNNPKKKADWKAQASAFWHGPILPPMRQAFATPPHNKAQVSRGVPPWRFPARPFSGAVHLEGKIDAMGLRVGSAPLLESRAKPFLPKHSENRN